ncbi:MAG TPA: glycosyltransferase family 2 protein [Candidatus Limnocylindrales bacterium]|nr:glycosyltransferase family 2 protein [Candidatus Limnocylindrales bacterium]
MAASTAPDRSVTPRPRISVVVPSFNQAAYLPAALDSLLDQGYPDLEVIVIDGASGDGSAAIVRAYAPHLAYFVSEPDRGQSHAINKGFAQATGDVLTWLNSDDLLMPGALEAVGEIFAAFPQVQWLTGQPANLGADGVLRHFPLKAGYFAGAIRRGWYHGRALGFIRQEGTFWRRALWDRVGGALDEARYYTMDYDLWRRLARHAPLIAAGQTLAAFREHAAQKTAALDGYYAEAGVHLPPAARFISVPARALISPLAWRIGPHVIRAESGWALYGLPPSA